MLLNLRSKYAACYNLFDAISRYSESDVLKSFSNEDQYMSSVEKYESENDINELTVVKNEIDKTCELITAKTSENLELIEKNQNLLKKSYGNMELYYFCEIYPLQMNVAFDSIHQAALMRESLRLRKIIDRLNNNNNEHEYKRLSSEIDLLESEATSYRLQGKLNELRYKTDCFDI